MLKLEHTSFFAGPTFHTAFFDERPLVEGNTSKMVAVEDPVNPIFRSGGSATRPGVSAGTRKHEMPFRSSDVRAITL